MSEKSHDKTKWHVVTRSDEPFHPWPVHEKSLQELFRKTLSPNSSVDIQLRQEFGEI